MNEKKTKYRFFGVWNSDKEEKWLEEMAKDGWILLSIGFLKYTFRKDEPCDMCYQFDFVTQKQKDQAEYLAIYKEAGWNFIGNIGGWFYFSKTRKAGEPEKIYSDSDSLIDMYKRVIVFLFIANGPTLYFIIMSRTSVFKEISLSWINGVLLFMMIIEVIMIYAIVRLVLYIRKLKHT